MTLKILALDVSSSHIGICFDGHIYPTYGLWGNISQRASAAAICFDTLMKNNSDCDLVVIESPVARYAKVLIPQARVSGAVLARVGLIGVAWLELAPKEAKKSLTGKGNATKAEMIAAASAELLNTPLDEHQADAYALWLAARKHNVTKEAAA